MFIIALSLRLYTESLEDIGILGRDFPCFIPHLFYFIHLAEAPVQRGQILNGVDRLRISFKSLLIISGSGLIIVLHELEIA